MGDESQQDFMLDGSVSMGVDIVAIDRIKAILKRTPSFTKRAFSDDEQAYCNKSSQPENHYATRFAAKEAVLKALGTGFSEGIGLKDVEVALNSKGKPHVRLHRRASQIAAEQGIREIPISLSYTHKEAVACALAITDSDLDKIKKKNDPTQELARQFKEARRLLDDLDEQDQPEDPQPTLPNLSLS